MQRSTTSASGGRELVVVDQMGTGPWGAENCGPTAAVIALVAAGLANAVIAQRLHLSPKTVANYLTSVFAKLGVTDRGQAIVAARDAGLGRPAG